MAFSPDGKTILTGSDDKTAQLWNMAVPLEGGIEQIDVWTQLITGMELDENNVVGFLDGDKWRQRRQRLAELGGPPRRSSNGR